MMNFDLEKINSMSEFGKSDNGTLTGVLLGHQRDKQTVASEPVEKLKARKFNREMENSAPRYLEDIAQSKGFDIPLFKKTTNHSKEPIEDTRLSYKKKYVPYLPLEN